MVKIPKLCWLIAVVLLLSTVINYTARLTLSVVVGEVLRQFSMTERDYAQIVSLFLVAYALMYAGSGYVVDRLGTRIGFAVFVFTWSTAQVLDAFVRGKWSLAACQFLLGLAEPGNFPAAVKVVDEWFPADRRATAVGLFNTGSSLGAAMGAPIAAFLTVRYGWRSAFIFTGALGFIWVAIWLIIYPAPDSKRWLLAQGRGSHNAQERVLRTSGERAREKSGVLQLLRSRQCYTLVLARFFTDPVVYFIIFWFPSYLEKARGFNITTIGKYAWMPFFFGGAGYVFGGWLSGRLMRAGWSLPKARKAAMLAGACLMPSAIVAPLVPTASLAITGICFVVFGHAIWIANLLTLPADLFERHQVGTGTGLSGAGGGISAILATLGTGYVVTHFSYKPIFVLAGLMHPISMALIFWLLPDRDFQRAT